MMIEGRADVDQKDASGQTALMAAAKFGDAALSKVLLDCGADPTVEDDLGRTATDMVKVEPVVEAPWGGTHNAPCPWAPHPRAPGSVLA